MHKNTIPAYKDRSLANRPREKWADIPGLDGYYRVSNAGRIKRLEREVPYIDGTFRILPGKILAPRVQRSANKYKGDYTYQLNIPLRLDKITRDLQIRRLVYYCFVSPFAIDDPNIMIVSKKGDGLDVRPGNLLLILRSENSGRIWERKRSNNSFSKEDWEKGKEASAKVTGREVSQYTDKGKLIRTFPSVMEAARSTGISHSRISHTVTGRSVTGGGYYWQYGHKKRMDPVALWRQRRTGYQQRGIPVAQYSLTGKFIAEYSSTRDAAEALGRGPSGISANLRGVTQSAYGFRWQRL